MGTFIYGTHGLEVDIEDHTLRHLRDVITSKLRKRECFCLTLPDRSRGELTVWMDASIPVAFRLDEDGADEGLNGAWLLRLHEAADHPAGLHIMDEPPRRVAPIGLIA
ncbi:hypothetical protein ACPW96_15095 [Micromonospora sp. DT81.3]|uniref:DUF7882 family protein n=1 Tax=Actinomycetes TaxID=1760 RepID=UPI003CF3996E